MVDLAFASAVDLAAAIRRREVSPIEVIEATLARIEQLNPRLNAFVVLRTEAAQAEARALAERLAHGEEVGPLAGVPFGVKDEEDVAGLPTTYGSVPMRNNVAAHDSTQVARLKRAGGICIGKTNLPEFGHTAYTKNRLFGVTRNPWNLARTPGGSSGGSAAAVAAGLVPLATGFDGGGSVRIPACYTGLVGMKPTFGRIPRGPFSLPDFSDTISAGPLARSVADAALYLDAVVGYDAHDRDSLAHPGGAYRAGLEEVPSGLRIAYSPTLGYAKVAPDVRREVDAAVNALGRTLGRPIDVIDDRLTDAGLAWAGINAFEKHAQVAPLLGEHREDFTRGFLVGVDIGGRLTANEFGLYDRLRQQLISDVARIFTRYDVLLTPTLPTTAFGAEGPLPTGFNGEMFDSPIHIVAFTYPFNLTGHPALSVRAGFSDERLPVGLQLVAERGRDDLLLKVARAYERARPFDEWPREPRGAP